MSIDNVHTETIRRVFDDASADFDGSGLDFFRPFGERLAQIADARPGDHVLDVGCGLGSSLVPAAARVGPTGSVIGIDVAPAMVRRLTERLTHQKITNARVVQMDGERPDFPDGTFDVVQAGFSIMHFSSAPACLSRYRHVLRSGGGFCYSELVDDDGLPDLVPREAFAVLEPFFPTDRPNPRERGRTPWNATAESIRSTMVGQGFTTVIVTEETSLVDVGSGHRWNAWTLSTGLRQAWANVPADQLAAVRSRTAEAIERHRDARGRLGLPARVRYVSCEVD